MRATESAELAARLPSEAAALVAEKRGLLEAFLILLEVIREVLAALEAKARLHTPLR